MIEIQHLTEQDIPQVFQLSNRIFEPILRRFNRNETEEVWHKNFEQNGILLGAYLDDTLAGYLFFYEKEKGTKSLHCWMAGVDEKSRGNGILKSLMEAGQRDLKDKGYEQMTINTIPELFPAMYAYLKKYHFTLYKEEQKDWDGIQTKKCFFRKQL